MTYYRSLLLYLAGEGSIWVNHAMDVPHIDEYRIRCVGDDGFGELKPCRIAELE